MAINSINIISKGSLTDILSNKNNISIEVSMTINGVVYTRVVVVDISEFSEGGIDNLSKAVGSIGRSFALVINKKIEDAKKTDSCGN